MALVDQHLACSSASSSWMHNEEGSSPCTVAYQMMRQCSADTNFRVMPLNSSQSTYANPLAGQWCTCNRVVYNLMSACAVCQEGISDPFYEWTSTCIDVSDSYPDEALAGSLKIPRWAYTKLSRRATFDVDAAEAASSDSHGWSPIQIALPVIVAAAVALLAGLGFYLYRRRMKRRYTRLADPHPSPGIEHRPGHVTSVSASSLNTHRSLPSEISLSRPPAPKRKKSKVAVAWERAKLQGPRKLGGLLADRATVHNRTRNATWSIDADSDHGHGSGGKSSGHTSKEASASSEAPSSSHPHHQAHASQTSLVSSIARLARHGRSESQVGLLSSPEVNSPNSPPLRASRDSQGSSGLSPNPLSRLVTGLAGHFREPPVPVVNGAPRRGFDVEDVDAMSPTNSQDYRLSESYVVVDGHQEVMPNGSPHVPVRGRLPPLNPLRTALPVSRLSPIPSRHDSEGSTDAVVNSGREERRRSRNESNESPGVMLISRHPGQDFNSVNTPITLESDVLPPFRAASTDNGHWSAPLSDTSSVLLPSFARATATHPTEDALFNPYPNHPQSPPRQLPPQPQLLQQPPPSPLPNQAASIALPRSPRALPQPMREGTLLPNAGLFPISPTSNEHADTDADFIPQPSFSQNSRQSPRPHPLQIQPTTSQTQAHANRPTHDEPPPSAFTQNTNHTNTSSQNANAGSSLSHSVSDHSSSSYAYTIPNPFVFDSAKGGARSAATALRLASPSRSGGPGTGTGTGSYGEGSDVGVGSGSNPFRRMRSESFDLAG